MHTFWSRPRKADSSPAAACRYTETRDPNGLKCREVVKVDEHLRVSCPLIPSSGCLRCWTRKIRVFHASHKQSWRKSGRFVSLHPHLDPLDEPVILASIIISGLEG